LPGARVTARNAPLAGRSGITLAADSISTDAPLYLPSSKVTSVNTAGELMPLVRLMSGESHRRLRKGRTSSSPVSISATLSTGTRPSAGARRETTSQGWPSRGRRSNGVISARLATPNSPAAQPL